MTIVALYKRKTPTKKTILYEVCGLTKTLPLKELGTFCYKKRRVLKALSEQMIQVLEFMKFRKRYSS